MIKNTIQDKQENNNGKFSCLMDMYIFQNVHFENIDNIENRSVNDRYFQKLDSIRTIDWIKIKTNTWFRYGDDVKDLNVFIFFVVTNAFRSTTKTMILDIMVISFVARTNIFNNGMFYTVDTHPIKKRDTSYHWIIFARNTIGFFSVISLQQ